MGSSPKIDGGNLVVQPGEITRRLVDSFIPDCYRDDPVNDLMVKFLELVGPSFDFFFEKSKALPQLVDCEKVPYDLLKHLGNLVGHEWDAAVGVEAQRHLICALTDTYKIKGTLPHVVSCVRRRGAEFEATISTPYDFLFRWSEAENTWSGSHVFEDLEFYRWGTYEIISDIPLADYLDKVPQFHPAGTKYFSRYKLYVSVDPTVPEQEVSAQITIDFPRLIDLITENTAADLDVDAELEVSDDVSAGFGIAPFGTAPFGS